ncbi:hypothetical protein ES708_24015 [subsurface metagenome]
MDGCIHYGILWYNMVIKAMGLTNMEEEMKGLWSLISLLSLVPMHEVLSKDVGLRRLSSTIAGSMILKDLKRGGLRFGHAFSPVVAI